MKNHTGWIYVLKTKNGFINLYGEETKNITEAIRIHGSDVDAHTAYQAYKKLGFNNESITEKNIKYFTLELSYEAKIAKIRDYLVELGEEYSKTFKPANFAFDKYNLTIQKNYVKFMKSLEKLTYEYYKEKGITQTIKLYGKEISLHEVECKRHNETDYSTQKFYSNKGPVFKYSFNLKNPHIEKYFNMSEEELTYYNNWQNNGIEDYIKQVINDNNFFTDINKDLKVELLKVNNNKLEIYFSEYSREFINLLNTSIRKFYSKKEMHITRMFGSYILLLREEYGLKAVHATPIPIKYCPLMINLLKEVAGDYANELIKTLETNDTALQKQCMCKLINETVIKSGYFDTSRPLNSCEANVLFGASETMSSALKNKLIDAAVIVSNNLGTIITTNEFNTQGAVKRMTGLFYTTASEEIVKTAKESGIIPVFPYSGQIDQLQGVKKAIKLGYKKIAVSVAANDNFLHEELKKLETENIKIYKLGLCSTGITKDTAEIMKDNADVVWSCASKYVKEIIEPNAIAQIGIKIPVHIMTKDGWEIIKNHLTELNKNTKFENIELQKGEEKPVCLNQKGTIKVLQKKQVKKCNDCPNPCI